MARLYREYVAGTTAQYRLLQRIVDCGAREISPSRTSSLPTLRALYAAIKPFTSNATWAISELWEYSSLSDVLPYRLHGQTDGTLSQDVRLAVEADVIQRQYDNAAFYATGDNCLAFEILAPP